MNQRPVPGIAALDPLRVKTEFLAAWDSPEELTQACVALVDEFEGQDTVDLTACTLPRVAVIRSLERRIAELGGLG